MQVCVCAGWQHRRFHRHRPQCGLDLLHFLNLVHGCMVEPFFLIAGGGDTSRWPGPWFYTRLRKRQWEVRCLIWQELNFPGTDIHRARVALGWLDEWGEFRGE